MRTRSAWIAAAVLWAAAGAGLPNAAAKDDKPPEVDAPEKVKPGQLALLKAPKGMRYFLRVPKGYNAKAGARLVVFLHGSNMNGLAYVRSFEAKRWADDDILCCPNGEQGTDPFGGNNFTFDSAPLVADVTAQVKAAFKTTVAYVGGHSQGAFLTYGVILEFPDLFQGAMPMAGDCWSQNEPNLWEDKPDVLKVQREIAIAVVHGKADPVVQFEQGQHAYDVFRAMGWRKLRLFAPEHVEHQFMLYPVDEVLDWLDAMNGRNEKKAGELAAKWAKDGEWGWAQIATQGSKGGGGTSAKGFEDAAAKAAATTAAARKGAPLAWIPNWLEFWRVFGGSAAAKPLVDDYLEKRAAQRADGSRLFQEAQGLFRQQKRDEAYEVLERLLKDAPCSFEGYYAWKWLSEKSEKSEKPGKTEKK